MGRCGAFPLRRQEVCVVGCGWRESEHAGACLSLAGEFAQTLEVVFEWMMVLRELEPKIPPRALRVELMEALKALRAGLMANPHDTDVFSEAEIRIVVSNFLASCDRSQYQASTAVTVEPIDEKPWVNDDLELAGMVLRSSKPGRA